MFRSAEPTEENSLARHFRTNVFIPDDWYEVPGDRRAYRRRAEGAGWLRLMLVPPAPEVREDAEAMVDRMFEMIEGAGLPDVGELCAVCDCPSMTGPMATSLWKSPRCGLLRFWFLPGVDVSVWATYTMGDLDGAQREMQDAQAIMESIGFEEIGKSDVIGGR
jgi:hypothetical protein